MQPKSIIALLTALLLAWGCANLGEPKLTGPSVPDQLNSRGYVTTKWDSMPRDTAGVEVDSLPER